MAVKKELKVRRFSARLMVGVRGANFLDAPRVPRAAQTFASTMVVVGDAVIKAALELQEVGLAYASGTEAARGARWTGAQRVLRESPAYASRTAGAVVANTHPARKVLKGAHSSVKLTVAVRGALFRGVQRVPRGALRFAKGMVVVRGALMKGAQKVCMVALRFVSVMVVGRDVQWQNALRAQGAVQTFVFDMAVVKGASLKGVVRVHKEVLISAKHMVEVSAAVGGRWDSRSATEQLLLRVINLQEGSQDFVLPIVPR